MKGVRILTALAVAGGFMVMAPDAVTAQQPVPQEQQAVEVTDELIEQFVAIYPSVVEVGQEMQAELATAQTAEEAQAMQADAQERITAVLEEGDMTVVEYEAVVTRLNNDPELLAEVQEMLAEDEQGGGIDR